MHDANHPGGIERRLREAGRVGPPGEEALAVELLPLARDHAAHVLLCLAGSEPWVLLESLKIFAGQEMTGGMLSMSSAASCPSMNNRCKNISGTPEVTTPFLR